MKEIALNSNIREMLKMPFYIKHGLFISEVEEDILSTTCREVAACDMFETGNSIFMCKPKTISLYNSLKKVEGWIGVKASTQEVKCGNIYGVKINKKSGFWSTILGYELFSLFCRSYTIVKPNGSFNDWQKAITGKYLFNKDVVKFIANFKKLTISQKRRLSRLIKESDGLVYALKDWSLSI